MLDTELRRSVRIGGLIFVASRLYLIAALVWAACFVPMYHQRPFSTGSALLDPLVTWDGAWYLQLVYQGYFDNHRTQSNLGYFPFYPLLIKIFWSIFHIPAPWAGILISNFEMAAVLILMHRMIAREFEPAVADRATFALAFFPAAIHTAAVYSESTFMLMVILAFDGMQSGRPLKFGIFAALATATRLMGMVLAISALVRAVQARRKGEPVAPWVVAAALTPLGFFAFMAWTAWRVGDPLAYVHAQSKGWGHSLAIPVPRLIYGPWESWHGFLTGDTEAFALNFWLWLLWIGGAIGVCRLRSEMRGPYAAYVVGGLLLISCASPIYINSYVRYVMTLFPVFIVGAQLSIDRPWIGRVLLWLTLFFDAAVAMLHSRWYWVA